jgi:hypothetical protein
MSTNLPTKSSSRAGRFKKKLVSEESLEKEAPVIEDRMAPVLRAYDEGILSPSEFTAFYILMVLAYRFPGTWLGSKTSPITEEHQLKAPLELLVPYLEPNIQRRLQGVASVGDIFRCFSFRSTPVAVNRAILEWSTGHYGLELMFRIPRPEEVLEQQKRGRRCVTVILNAQRASRFILGERDALGFTMHDLIHADHFYHHNQSYQGQLGFYGFLDHCLREGHFKELLEDKRFESEFEYLIADMNAYAIHLLKCFKAALVHYHPQKEQFFLDWLGRFELQRREKEAFLALNNPEFDPNLDDPILLEYLLKWRHS